MRSLPLALRLACRALVEGWLSVDVGVGKGAVQEGVVISGRVLCRNKGGLKRLCRPRGLCATEALWPLVLTTIH